MVDELFQWQDFDIKLVEAFSPATPISRGDFFRGRRAVVRRVIEAANQPGQHVLIYGERGVGKTSLANVIAEFLSPFTSEQIASHKVICNRESTFTTIWTDLFTQMGLEQRDPWGKITPHEVLNALPRDRKHILIVDEFDRLQDPDIDALFADTVKAISDGNVDTTLVLVGVADDVDDLITEHASIDRCLVQIHLNRMGFDELKEIIEAGISQAGLQINANSTNRICLLSMGLPHYTHAFGLNAGRAAIDRKMTRVTTRDVDEASTVSS